jgi:hypothetical protein
MSAQKVQGLFPILYFSTEISFQMHGNFWPLLRLFIKKNIIVMDFFKETILATSVKAF